MSKLRSLWLKVRGYICTMVAKKIFSAAFLCRKGSHGKSLRHHCFSHSNSSSKAPQLCLLSGVRLSLSNCSSGKKNGKEKKQPKKIRGKKGEWISCIILGNHRLLSVLWHASAFIGCLVVFWPNIPVLMHKSCPTLILTHANVSSAVVEAAVSWIIAWRLLVFHADYETIQTS